MQTSGNLFVIAARALLNWLVPDVDSVMLAFTASALLLVTLAILYWILDRPVSAILSRVVKRTSIQIDDYLLNRQNVKIACLLITTFCLYRWLPPCIASYPKAVSGANTWILIAITMLTTRLLVLLIKSSYRFFEDNENVAQTARSLRGIGQLFQTIIVCIAIIIIVSILIHRSPLFILSGLGASAAVLLLVFKETILGFMASIRLNSNNMLQVGDWITMPSRNINGVVKEICLTTVKIENYDMTIVTVPPHALVSESFQNWRGMYSKGARRITRTVNIDLNTVRYLSPDELQRFAEEPWAKDLNLTEPIVNLTVFRRYLKYYISSEPTFLTDEEEKLYCMVRELTPTPQGLPIEIYLFTSQTTWPDYEEVQASLTDHILAAVPTFGLRVYQQLSDLSVR